MSNFGGGISILKRSLEDIIQGKSAGLMSSPRDGVRSSDHWLAISDDFPRRESGKVVIARGLRTPFGMFDETVDGILLGDLHKLHILSAN